MFSALLAGLVGPSGLVVGVDPSSVLLAEAQRRAADADGTLPLCFTAADARGLPFGAHSFDGCRAERVFQHLGDPLGALSEMIRVTRSGGRILVLDTDWGTTAVSGADRRLTRRVLAGFCDHITQSWIGPQLPRLFHQAGLTHLEVVAETSWSRDRPAATDRPCPQLAAGAIDQGAITTTEARHWLYQLAEAADHGTFLWATTGFAVAATTPTHFQPSA